MMKVKLFETVVVYYVMEREYVDQVVAFVLVDMEVIIAST